MEFPTLFPVSDADWLKPHICSVELHEYALDTCRYYDKIFGSHPNFQYYLLNMIMWHRSQETVAVFAKEHLHDNSPTTIEEL